MDLTGYQIKLVSNVLKPPHLQLDNSAKAYTGSGFIGHIALSGGSNKTVVTLYDNTVAGGTILDRFTVDIENDIETSYESLGNGKHFKNGIYVEFGSGSSGALVIITLG